MTNFNSYPSDDVGRKIAGDLFGLAFIYAARRMHKRWLNNKLDTALGNAHLPQAERDVRREQWEGDYHALVKQRKAEKRAGILR